MTIDDFKKEKIAAMKAHDADAVSALNSVINKLMSLTIERRAKGEGVTDADAVAVLQKVEKELAEERSANQTAGRSERVAELDRQIEAIGKYLPKQMTSDEIKAEILGLADRSVPTVMRHFKANFAGKCDMKLVSEVLKSL